MIIYHCRRFNESPRTNIFTIYVFFNARLLFVYNYLRLFMFTYHSGETVLVELLAGPRSDGHVFSVWKKRYVTWGAKCRKRLLGIGSIF